MGTKGGGAWEDQSRSQCTGLSGLFPKEVLSFGHSSECVFSQIRDSLSEVRLPSKQASVPQLPEEGPTWPRGSGAQAPTCLSSLPAAPRRSCLQLDPSAQPTSDDRPRVSKTRRGHKINCPQPFRSRHGLCQNWPPN